MSVLFMCVTKYHYIVSIQRARFSVFISNGLPHFRYPIH